MFTVYLLCMYVQLNLFSNMSVTDYKPIFHMNMKKSGKKFLKFLIGEHSFYRFSLKTTGYATFSCDEKQCKSSFSYKCISQESALESEVEPEILRYIFDLMKLITRSMSIVKIIKCT